MLQRLYPEGLASSLAKGLVPFYLLSGQDHLLIDEAKQLITRTAGEQEFDEKSEISIASDPRWEEIEEQAQSGGLFFRRQIILLNLPENMSVAQQKALERLLALSHSDLLFILHLPKFSKTTEKQSWFNYFTDNAVLVNCQTPEITKMPMWLTQRAKIMGLQLDKESIQLLCYSYEGNLLALNQTLHWLKLQFGEQPITPAQTAQFIEQSAQFTPFQWIDALLLGKIPRAIRILHCLENEEVQAVVLLRILQKELMLLLEISRAPQPISSKQMLFCGQLRTEFDRLKIWQNKRPTYQAVLQRLSYRKLFLIIQALAQIEKSVKQEFSNEVWHELERLSLHFR